jgi:hypothetical protein
LFYANRRRFSIYSDMIYARRTANSGCSDIVYTSRSDRQQKANKHAEIAHKMHVLPKHDRFSGGLPFACRLIVTQEITTNI